MTPPVPRLAASLVLALVCVLSRAPASGLAFAQGAEIAEPAPPAQAGAQAPGPQKPPAPTTPPNPLPAPSLTRHVVELPGRSLRFSAKAGAVRLSDAQSGEPQADVAYVYYALENPPPGPRPIVFALNGGPGAASGWLNIGALGPWLLDLGAPPYSPSRRAPLVPNAQTWLDFADLVFIDPPLTGYSRILAKGDGRRALLSVDGDVSALAVVIRKFLAAEGRLQSPVFLVGESYGGFRAPKIARALQDQEGIGVAGLVLISPVLDFGWFDAPNSPLPAATQLPSIAAAARGLKPSDGEALAEVEGYAAGPYLSDLLRAEREADARGRVVDNVARLTGLDARLVERAGGRLDPSSLARELKRGEGRFASRYDFDVSGFSPAPHEERGESPDPVLDATKSAFASGMAELTAGPLGWPIDARYEILNERANGEWSFGSGRQRPQALSDLKQALALDPALRVLIVHGLTDLVTPYFASKLLIGQLPPYGDPGRVALKVYEGGHMPWLAPASRAALREDAKALIEAR